jgi:hypothetical protein
MSASVSFGLSSLDRCLVRFEGSGSGSRPACMTADDILAIDTRTGRRITGVQRLLRDLES